jgi:NAD(P)-dependent dehydrogenase (short-subunit alcohol dehydrogenase family)
MSGRVAVVTGGGRGIGRGIAEALCEVGAAVVIAELDEELGPAAELELSEAGHAARWVRTNVRDGESIEAMMAETISRHGRVDVLVNNAGGMFRAPALDISERGFLAVVNQNLTSTFLASRAAAKAMARQGGSIVNIASIAGMVGHLDSVHYASAKAGIIGLTRSLAAE